jgi:hypothetical protein
MLTIRRERRLPVPRHFPITRIAPERALRYSTDRRADVARGDELVLSLRVGVGADMSNNMSNERRRIGPDEAGPVDSNGSCDLDEHGLRRTR